jgi:hypothetical protein
MTDDGDGDKVPMNERTPFVDEWKNAVDIEDLPPGSVKKVFAMGVNIRVKLPAAFIAGYQMVMAGFSVAEAIASSDAWPKAMVDAYRAAQAVFVALIEKMKPLPYITAVILSQSPEGLEESDLVKKVNEFLDAERTAEFGWHLGMSKGRLEDARKARYDGWPDQILKELESNGFLSRSGTKLSFQQKNYEWTFTV